MNISDISELQKIILRSAARRKMPGMMIPVYRVLGRVRRFVSGRILEPSEIMDTLKPFELHLEKLGYVQWILIVFDNFLNFHFGQCRTLEMAEALK
ncbi:MAG: hypothetical protein JRI45_02590 [Deltaproteobacteria bacterium]|nr:hypothetical protein [Deltaproteobacteria bacterium]MBW2068816.1 hypothetical protein [Deltaproteobacteria bacterium]